MQLTSTSTQRTYRYLRISIVGSVVVLFLALAVVTAGIGPVTSLSALFYTPGRSLFTGTLFAVALALLALAGRSVEQVLLNLAALFAPIIAIVPTPIAPGDAPHVAARCPGGYPCVPVTFIPEVHVGIVTFAVAAVLGAALALVLGRVQRLLTTGVVLAAVVAAVLAAIMLVWAFADVGSLLAVGHLVSTAGFFGLMAAVAVVSALGARGRWRRIYLAVAIGMGVLLVYLATVMIARLAGADQAGQPWVLVGEVGLVALFAVYWLAQTAQRWNEVDPALMAP